MNATTGLKRGVGGVVAAAAMLAVAMAPSGSALADTSVTVDTNATETLTINGTNQTLGGHTFKAIRLAAYTDAQADGAYLTAVSVTSTAGLSSGLQAAYQVANGGTAIAPADADNVMAKVSSQWLGFPSLGNNTTNQDTTSNAPGQSAAGGGYRGKLRNFVTSLVGQSDVQAAFAGSSAYTAAGPAVGGTPSTAAEAEFTGLPTGLYLIIDTTGSAGPTAISGTNAAAAIPMLAGTALKSTAPVTRYTRFKMDSLLPELGNVDMKNNVPTLKKELMAPSYDSASIGDTLSYQIVVSVPLTTGFSHYTYKITDLPGAGLTYVPGSETVEVVHAEYDDDALNPSPYVSGTNYVVTPAAPANGQAVAFDLSKSMISIGSQYYGELIRIKFDMKINDNATSANIANGVKLAYSNDPSKQPTTDNGDDTNTSTSDGTVSTITNNDSGTQVPVYFYHFQMRVQSKIDSSVKLSGATFKIVDPSDVSGNTYLRFMKLGDGSYKKVSSSTAIGGNVSEELVSANGGGAGDDDLDQGEIKIDGLGANTYTVKETVVPAGYGQAFASTFTVKMDVSGSFSAAAPGYSNTADTWNLVTAANWLSAANDTHYITVQEVTSFAQLPMTGGAGAIVVALAVVALLGGAGAIYIYTRRSEKSLSQEA